MLLINSKDYKEKYYSNLWRKIDFEESQNFLYALQEKLSIESKRKNWDKIKYIQDLITNSIEIRSLIVKKVIEGSGKRPGIDGILCISDSDKYKGAISLVPDNYKAKPFRRIVIQDKHKNKERHISIPTIKDRCMISLYAHILDPISESTADKKSFAFRKGRSALDAHSFVCDSIKYPNSPEWILISDVKSCYESVSHKWIMDNIPINKKVLYSFLKAGFIFEKELFPTEHGVSLGMSISPIIANMSLDGLQKIIFELQHSKSIDYSNGNFIRYADDIIVTSKTREFAIKIKSEIEKFLSIRGMKLSEKKTKIVHISQGFDFLSRHYYKQNGIFYVIPSSKAIKSFEDNLQNFIINKGKQISQRSLIKGINAKLQGWAGYHRVEDSLNTFKHIDCIVSSLLLKLMKQIFPSKSEKQIINTYWYEEYGGKKVYSLPQRRDIRVIRLSDVILVDHQHVILNKNPYIDRKYFELRLKSQDIQKINGDLKSIWRRQRGRCFYCGRKFFKDQQKN